MAQAAVQAEEEGRGGVLQDGSPVQPAQVFTVELDSYMLSCHIYIFVTTRTQSDENWEDIKASFSALLSSSDTELSTCFCKATRSPGSRQKTTTLKISS